MGNHIVEDATLGATRLLDVTHVSDRFIYKVTYSVQIQYAKVRFLRRPPNS